MSFWTQMMMWAIVPGSNLDALAVEGITLLDQSQRSVGHTCGSCSKRSLLGILLFGSLPSIAMAASKPRAWRTPALARLDSQEFLDKARDSMRGRVPGTHNRYDAQKIAQTILDMVVAELQHGRGLHAETALATLGALAGFAVQMGIREEYVRTGKIPEDKAFVIVKTKDGQTYYFGDLLNEGLFENKPGNLSVYSLVGGAAQHVGATKLPDVSEIAHYVASTVGTEAFGVLRVVLEHKPHQPPIELLNRFWNPIRNFLATNVQAPTQWPLVLALAAQKFLINSRGEIEPGLAAEIVMQSAIAMAKIEPSKIHHASFF